MSFDVGDAAFAGAYMGAFEEEEVVPQQRQGKTVAVIRAELIAEMRRSGMLLSEYDWSSKDFVDAQEKIMANWFLRHPETTRGNGDFGRTYPAQNDAIETLNKMASLHRITPKEYLSLFEEICNY